MDKLTLHRIQLLHPALRAETLKAYEEVCKAVHGRSMVRMTYTLRTFKEQAALFAQGRTKPGPKVTNAAAGQSYHNYGLAFDICMVRDLDGDGDFDKAVWDLKLDADGDGKGDWMEAVAIFKRYGWEWGGDWKKFPDAPHFQKTFGQHWADLQRKYKAGKLKGGYVTL